MPHNTSLWQNLTNPWWVLFRVWCVIPFWGLSFWSHLLYFTCMDRTDEYQLVAFILSVKGNQFVRLGVVAAVTAYMAYWRCVNWGGQCQATGPGSSPYFGFEMIALALQTALSWLAFTYLPQSTKQGVLEALKKLYGSV